MQSVAALPHPDLAARWVIVNAYLYYVLDSPLMPDADYDGWSQYVADNWKQLSPDRQWALDSPRKIRASGFHIKFSSYAVGAAEYGYHTAFRKGPPRTPSKWLTRKDGCRYVTVGMV
jgi:hypothetical protein